LTRFILLTPYKVCNPPTYLYTSLFPSCCADRWDAAPDLNTVDAFLRRAKRRKAKRVLLRFIVPAPCDCTFTLKAPFKRTGVEGDYSNIDPIRGKPARRTICEKRLKIPVEIVTIVPANLPVLDYN